LSLEDTTGFLRFTMTSQDHCLTTATASESALLDASLLLYRDYRSREISGLVGALPQREGPCVPVCSINEGSRAREDVKLGRVKRIQNPHLRSLPVLVYSSRPLLFQTFTPCAASAIQYNTSFPPQYIHQTVVYDCSQKRGHLIPLFRETLSR